MMRSRSLAARTALLIGFLLVVGAGSAHAQTLEIEGTVGARIGEQSDFDFYSDTQATGPIADSALAVVEPSPGGTPAARCESSALADFGTLKVSLYGETTGGPELLGSSGNSGYGNAFAFFEDWVTVVAPLPALSNTRGTARVRVRVGGHLDADSGGAADANVHADYALLVRFAQRFCEYTDPDCSDAATGLVRDLGSLGGGKSAEGEPLPLSFEARSLPFYFDQPFRLGVELGVTASADGDEEERTATALANLGSTLQWDGFTEVRDGEGTLVDDYEIESLSGIDWALPVPEPEAGLAAAASIAWLSAAAAAARRRRRTAERAAPKALRSGAPPH